MMCTSIEAILVVVVLILIGVVIRLAGKLLDRKGESKAEPYDGDIFVNDEGEIYAQFDVPVTEIVKKKRLSMKVHHVKHKKEK